MSSNGASVEEFCFCVLWNDIFCLCIVEWFRAVLYNSQGKIRSSHWKVREKSGKFEIFNQWQPWGICCTFNQIADRILVIRMKAPCELIFCTFVRGKFWLNFQSSGLSLKLYKHYRFEMKMLTINTRAPICRECLNVYTNMY